MLSSELREILLPMGLAQRIVWFAITASIGVFVVLAHVVAAGGMLTVNSASLLAAGGLALALAAYSHWQYRRVRSDEAMRSRIASGPPMPPAGGPTARSRLRERYESLPDADKRLLGLVLSLQRSLIVSLALHETIAMVGLVLAILSGRPALVLPFAAVAVVLNLLIFPRPESEIRRARTWSRMGGA